MAQYVRRIRDLPRHNGTLSLSSSYARSATALAPLEHSNGYNADDENQSRHQTSATRAAQRSLHIREPEGPDEAPGRADDVDEDADAGAVLDVAVDGVGDEDRGHDLVADGRDGDADLESVLVNGVMGR